ncbi:MAG: methyltransferase domain-containing protein [Lachnospiraceae bacterium]|nr:methyltransferase domain-containing protein [Lachnospiraceae bacterium]
MKRRLYGKPFGDLMSIKQDFFTQNSEMLEMSAHQADALLRQPKRKVCKICHEPIEGDILYESQRMAYYLCPNCGHVNSAHEDTRDFEKAVYLEDDYEHNYSEKDRAAFIKRRDEIYIPKAQFLLNILNDRGIKNSDIHVLDDGAGSGYFVSALRLFHVDAKGIEISKAQVDFGNAMIGENVIAQADSAKILSVISGISSNVISFIGVLEHITNLDRVIEAVRSNSHIQYVYMSVPMFSLSCILEAANQDCYNRHAGGTHTHLFTDESLEYLAERMGFKALASWKFGSDIMDLYRMLCVKLAANGNEKLKGYFAKRFMPLMDSLQEVVDKGEFASEIHMILVRK